jgi:small neutral amino acid transporter SnatA (MarC family)
MLLNTSSKGPLAVAIGTLLIAAVLMWRGFTSSSPMLRTLSLIGATGLAVLSIALIVSRKRTR